jgi:hypothetical protein
MSGPVALRGSLSDLSACEVLALLCRQEATGVLALKSPGTEKSVYFQQGRIVFAASRDADDRLGELLLTRGVITREQLEKASAHVGSGKRFGTVLVEMGFLPAAYLPRWVREQVKEIIFSIFSWGEGEYGFSPGPLPSGEVITLRISSAEIFLTGLRRVQKWSILRKGAGEIQIPYRLAAGYRQLLKDAHLEKEDESLIRLLESGSHTMEQAARDSTLTTLLVYQLFFALRVLGVLIPAAAVEPEAAPPGRPVLRPATTAAAPQVPVPAATAADGGQVPGPSPRKAAAAQPAESRPLGTVKEAPAPSPEPATGSDAGAQTVMLRVPPPTPFSTTQAEKAAAAQGTVARKREYKVIRVEGEKLEGNGTSQIEDLLGSWSRKGYSLAGIVPGKAASIFSSAPSSFFIFVRD